MEKPILPVIAGPTASGKTACAIALCRLINGEVVSADSMQIYSGMEILSAVPGQDDRCSVQHHLLGCIDPGSAYSVDAYRADAKKCISDILQRGKVPVLCGGTGLYIDAVIRPMSFASHRSDEHIRAKLQLIAEEDNGRRKLHDMLHEVDPRSADKLHENDVRRVVRALEVYLSTGVPLSEHVRADREGTADYRAAVFALDWPRDTLYQRIDARVEGMLSSGLVEEVRALMRKSDVYPTAGQAIGFKEISSALKGEISMDKAIYLTKKASRNLAKRQLTWLKREPDIIWLNADGATADDLAGKIRSILFERFGMEVVR